MKRSFTFAQKISLIAALLFHSAGFLNALPSQNVNEYRLENGLEIFILEDNSTPIVRIELCTRAGFSSQTKDNAGFFKLYTKLIQQNAKQSAQKLDFYDVQCNADSSRFIILTTAPQTEQMLSALSDAIFDADFTDELIESEFTKMQAEVRANAEDLSMLLTAAIDSRVFSASPWKHDSGVYPPLFSQIHKGKVHSILNTIKNKWYTPQNSALFISGNISSDEVLYLTEAYFGSAYASSSKPAKQNEEPNNFSKRFVIHDAEFSSEMTQIVLQYTNQNAEECDLSAAIFGNDYSSFKNMLLGFDELNIPGYEYIDASSVQNEDNSRLIIQSILEKPADKNLKTTPLKQGLLFEQAVRDSFAYLLPEEFYYAKQNLISDIQQIELSSSVFMDKLSSFWAIEPFYSAPEIAFETNTNSITADELLSRTTKIQRIIQNDLQDHFAQEEPFVFIIINSAEYKKNKKDFDSAGFAEITRKNAVWYNQENFEKILSAKEEPAILETAETYQKAGNQNFYNQSLSQIKKSSLKNGIPLTTKYSENFSKMTILLSIRGGHLHYPKEPGFEETMINLLAANIQNECIKNAGLFTSSVPKIDYKTNMTTSWISAECSKEDFSLCCKIICNAIVYGSETPSLADRIVAAKQYQKRLYNGTAVNQMYAKAVSILYPESDFINLFDASNDILTQMQYNRIQNEYPKLLDSSRYSIIIAGDFPQNYEDDLNKTFALLSNRNENIIFVPQTTAKLKTKRVSMKITHTFLTDIPAEKAPPMPAVLIPTTNFLDPVMYVFTAHGKETKNQAIFKALLLYFADEMQNELDNNQRMKEASVTVMLPRSQMEIASLVVQNAAHTKDADDALKNTAQKIRLQLGSNDSEQIIQKIKENWTLSQMEETGTNSGTAELMQKGIEFFPFENDTEYYLNEFNYVQNADVSDFLSALEVFEAEPILSIYSKDSKK